MNTASIASRLTVLAAAATLATAATGCVITSDDDSTLTVYNDSSYALYELYVAEQSDATWGSNLLYSPLFPGDSVTVVDIACGTYDVLVVDDTGVECELRGLDLCFDDEEWVVDNFTLDVCAFN